MALTKQQKQAQVVDLTERLKKASSVIFAHYIGLTVAQVSDLRRRLKGKGAEMKVAKKTLLKIAAKQAGLPEIADSALPGPVACIVSYDDPLVGTQVTFAFGKEFAKVALVGGIFEGKILSKQDALSLAQIQSRTVLLATFAGMIRSPLVSFASMCNSPLIGFARGLNEVAKKKSAA